MRILFVVPRYGEEAEGPAPARSRALAERLTSRGHEIEVLTTNALDPATWEGVLPAGIDQSGGIRVRRFPVEARPHRFRDAGPGDSSRVLGPVAPRLLAHLHHHGRWAEVLVFFGFGAWITGRGLMVRPHRSVLVPAEPLDRGLDGGGGQDLLRPRAVVFDTPEEWERVIRVLGRPLPGAVVAGRGVAAMEPATAPREGPTVPSRDLGGYVAFSGRLEAENGCAVLVERFLRFQREGRSGLTLVLAGRGRVALHENPHVRMLGELREAEVRSLLGAARAVIVPSPREALAEEALHAWAAGRPVLVDARSEVMRRTVARVGGGLSFRGYDELAASLELLEADAALADTLGRAGRTALQAEHAWPGVLTRWEAVLQRVGREEVAA